MEAIRDRLAKCRRGRRSKGLTPIRVAHLALARPYRRAVLGCRLGDALPAGGAGFTAVSCTIVHDCVPLGARKLAGELALPGDPYLCRLFGQFRCNPVLKFRDGDPSRTADIDGLDPPLSHEFVESGSRHPNGIGPFFRAQEEADGFDRSLAVDLLFLRAQHAARALPLHCPGHRCVDLGRLSAAHTSCTN